MRKIIVSIFIIVLILMSTGATIKAKNEIVTTENYSVQEFNECPINITVQEAWDLLTYTGNGIQIPIDVRYDYEWYSGFINTPWPESPRWYTKDLFQNNETFLQWFLDEYSGEELVIYCKGGYRSLIVCNILCEAGFTGTIYNTLGGITAWIAEGYPIRNNTPPEIPNIDGPMEAKKNMPTDFDFSTTDAENDGVCYSIDWGDGQTETTDYYYSNDIVTVSHTWSEKGNYVITAKAIDFYDNESDWGFLEIQVPKFRERNLNFNVLERISYVLELFRYLKSK